MSVARTVAQSPFRLSKKLQTCPLQSQSEALSFTTPQIQHAHFGTTLRKLQRQRPSSTPASKHDGNAVETGHAATTSSKTLTPTSQQEVSNVISSIRKPHRPQEQIKLDIVNLAKRRNIPLPAGLDDPNSPTDPRLPRNVQALFLAPLRRQPTHGIPVCNLQLRSFSVRNLEYTADFAMRAAYYLDLPAKGPVPLPRIIKRWTVPRSNFVHTKTQENFERVTLRRLIQIQDGHPDSVRRWLQFLRKHMWYGVGYKADVFDFEALGTAKKMDDNEDAVNEALQSIDWDLFGRRKGMISEEAVMEAMDQLGFAADESNVSNKPAKAKNPA